MKNVKCKIKNEELENGSQRPEIRGLKPDVRKRCKTERRRRRTEGGRADCPQDAEERRDRDIAPYQTKDEPQKLRPRIPKVRSDSKLHRLTASQRKKLEQWLFVENLSCQAVADKCNEEFGAGVNEMTVLRYYHREKSGWDVEQRAREEMELDLSTGRSDGEALYRALLGRMLRTALIRAQTPRDAADDKLVADYMKVLISARRESHEALRAATTREKFEFDAATACLIHQVKTQAIANDESLDDGQRIQKIREHLFGPDLPPAEEGVVNHKERKEHRDEKREANAQPETNLNNQGAKEQRFVVQMNEGEPQLRRGNGGEAGQYKKGTGTGPDPTTAGNSCQQEATPGNT